jgi:hypothetical protein
MLRCFEFPSVSRDTSKLNVDESQEGNIDRIHETRPSSENNSEKWQKERPPIVEDMRHCDSIGEDQNEASGV